MKEIQDKIKVLLQLNDVEPKYTFGYKGEDSFDSIMKKQQDLMDELKTLGKANKTLLGRIVQFPMGDSYALYVITKVNKKTVRITWVKYCDAWQDERVGYEANLDLKYAHDHVQGRDNMEELFSKKKTM